MNILHCIFKCIYECIKFLFYLSLSCDENCCFHKFFLLFLFLWHLFLAQCFLVLHILNLCQMRKNLSIGQDKKRRNWQFYNCWQQKNERCFSGQGII